MLSILAKIGFDWQVALANLVNFIIIIFILRKFAFNPIKEVISKRQSIINTGLENAKIAETDRVMADELKKSTLSEARLRADEIISDANRKAEMILSKAKSDAEILKSNIITQG
ncbi:MAG: ATP synthase F0 subunit B, partial [Minisyncoccia bacterium]